MDPPHRRSRTHAQSLGAAPLDTNSRRRPRAPRIARRLVSIRLVSSRHLARPVVAAPGPIPRRSCGVPAPSIAAPTTRREAPNNQPHASASSRSDTATPPGSHSHSLSLTLHRPPETRPDRGTQEGFGRLVPSIHHVTRPLPLAPGRPLRPPSPRRPARENRARCARFFLPRCARQRGRTARRGGGPTTSGKERNDERRATGPPAGSGPSGAAARSRVR